MGLDTQVVELLGRNRLTGELLGDGLEVAVPARDRGVDLIAYADLAFQVAAFAARPIQMKAFTARGFSVDRKYTKIADLLLAYVWHVGGTDTAVTYAMPHAAAVRVAEAMGWTETASWADGGTYTRTSPSKKLLGLLEPHRMGPGKWFPLVAGVSAVLDPGSADGRAAVPAAGPVTMGMLFRDEPPHWGLRGDPFLWADLARRLSTVTCPESPEAARAIIEGAFAELTGCPVYRSDPLYVGRYNLGGMSGGHVCPEFWRDTAIPLLLHRLRALPGRERGGAAPVPGAEPPADADRGCDAGPGC